MKKIILAVAFLLWLFAAVKTVYAVDTLVFDSTNHYLGGCQLTDKSEWELQEDLNVTKFQLWYSWSQGETKLPVSIFRNGEKFAEIETTRAECDPYQKQWCNASFMINKLFPKGNYSTEIPNKRQCLKPGGTGTVLLYGNKETTIIREPSPTPTMITVESSTDKIQPVSVNQQPATSCSCSQTTILATAAVTSAVTALIVSLILKKVNLG